MALLVDLENLAAVRHRLSVAVLDAAAITGSLTVRFANGSVVVLPGSAGYPLPRRRSSSSGPSPPSNKPLRFSRIPV